MATTFEVAEMIPIQIYLHKMLFVNIIGVSVIKYNIYLQLPIKENAETKDKQDMLSELDVMKSLQPHPHVVGLVGCCTEQGTGHLF